MPQPPANEESFYRTQARHVRQCLREARLAAVFWGAGLIYCVSMFLWLGYVPPEQRPDQPDLIWGMPAWVLWGLFLPWFAQIGLTWWFAACYMKEDEPYLDFPDQTGQERPEGRSK